MLYLQAQGRKHPAHWGDQSLRRLTLAAAANVRWSMPNIRIDVPDSSLVTLDFSYGTVGLIASSRSVTHFGEQVLLDSSGVSYAQEVSQTPEIVRNFRITDQLSLQSGQVWAGWGEIPDHPQGFHLQREQLPSGQWRRKRFLLGAWSGAQYSLHLHRYRGETQHLVNFLVGCRFSESEDGIVCDLPDGGAWGNDPMARIRIAEFGMVEIAPYGSSEALSKPRHSGMMVRGGELYRSDSSHRAYALFGSTAVLSVIIDEDEPALARWMESVEFGWKIP